MIGIIGGVGPFAGIALHQSILRCSLAQKDQDHLPVIHINIPSEIPDRTDYLLGLESNNPGVAIFLQVQKLVDCGATVIGIPCNTAHHPDIFDQLKTFCLSRGVVLVNMIRETLTTLGNERIGLLATLGTYRTHIYEHYNHASTEIILPDPELQGEVHEMIYHPLLGLKAKGEYNTFVRERLENTLAFFKSKGVYKVILGCTELAVFIPATCFPQFYFINTIHVLALKMIHTYEACHS